MDFGSLIERVRAGDASSQSELVAYTQRMVYAVCRRVLRDADESFDAAQETYLRAFARLNELEDAAALPGWLRRIAVTTALNMARRKRFAFLATTDVPEVLAFDESETAWSEAQRHSLAAALLRLDSEDRRICDRFYHGGWDIARLAADARISEPAMRKRLQRIRDRLREDTEMSEQRHMQDDYPQNLPARILELLALPKLIDLPENPVGRITQMLESRYAGYRKIDVPELVSVEDARAVNGEAWHDVPEEFVHFAAGRSFLRYDLTLPLLIALRGRGSPARLMTAGQVYRNQAPSPMRDQSFHQFEILLLDAAAALDEWQFMGQTLQVLEDLLPGRAVRIDSIEFASCSKAWEVAVEVDSKWIVVLSWGIYTPRIVSLLGADAATCRAFGLTFGLERMAAIHFGFDDIRKLAAARLAAGAAM